MDSFLIKGCCFLRFSVEGLSLFLMQRYILSTGENPKFPSIFPLKTQPHHNILYMKQKGFPIFESGTL